MELAFEDINVYAGQKHILKNVFGLSKSGQLLVIMGPSGAGKSTLLNVITGNMKLSSGRILFNGRQFEKYHKRKIGYVSQSDTFFPQLTMMETLWFAALVKLSDKMSYEEKMNKVNDIVYSLGLQNCVNTRIGDIFHPGLSGGEKRRLSIAVELLSNPSLLVLDEPTSGLDSAIAASLVSLIKKLSQEEGRAVITTIHQPSSQMFYMFDNLLLLAGGQVAYYGPAKDSMDFVTRLGYGAKTAFNPADYIMEKMKEDKECLESMTKEMDRLRQLKEWCADSFLVRTFLPPKSENSSFAGGFFKRENEKSLLVEKQKKGIAYDTTSASLVSVDKSGDREKLVGSGEGDDDEPRWQTSFSTQWKALTVRSFKIGRSRMLSKMKIVTQIIVMLYMIAIWTRVQATENDLLNRKGALFFMLMNWKIPVCIDQVSAINVEGPVVAKERTRGWYKLSAYFFAKLASELPLVVLLPILQGTVVYWSIGLAISAPAYFLWFVVNMISPIVSLGLGIMIGTVFHNIELGVNIGATLIVLLMLLTGFFQRNIPVWIRWLRYLSDVYYCLEAVTNVDIIYGGPFKCNPPLESSYPVCEQANSTGYITADDYFAQNYALPIWSNYVFLVGITFVVFIADYILLRIVRRQVY